MIKIDPAVFLEEAVSPETRALNERLENAFNAMPDPWTLDHRLVRKAREEGKGPFPLETPLAEASTVRIEGSVDSVDHGGIPIRIIPTAATTARGTYLHIHGGGWMYGEYDQQDQRMKRFADATGLNVVSVGYRLAPEHRWPAANEDCEQAARWLANPANHQLSCDFLAIGGESAGAHLATTTLLRMRDADGETPFDAAVLIAGCYDLRLSPSTRNFGLRRLVLNTRDVTKFADAFLADAPDRSIPDISPINADLANMPPAHFTVGTLDALMDDSIFMATRWSQKQTDTELDLWPGGCHVFHYFDMPLAHESNDRITQFLKRQMGKKQVKNT